MKDHIEQNTTISYETGQQENVFFFFESLQNGLNN